MYTTHAEEHMKCEKCGEPATIVAHSDPDREVGAHDEIYLCNEHAREMENSFDNFLSLGEQPKCDVCGRNIEAGQKAKQMFAGTVVNQDGGLMIHEENYVVAHVRCDKVN